MLAFSTDDVAVARELATLGGKEIKLVAYDCESFVARRASTMPSIPGVSFFASSQFYTLKMLRQGCRPL